MHLRLVSLLASATEMVDALGLTPYLVGRSHECDYPEAVRSLPVCTAPSFPIDGSSADIDREVKAKLQQALSLYEVFTPVLDELQPTHIITQTQCEVCAVSLADVEHALAGNVSSRPKTISLAPHGLPDIWDDFHRIADACGCRERGDAVIAAAQARMQEISSRAKSSHRRPRVACIEWLSPLMAAGNWVPELVELAHAANLFGEAGQHSPWLTSEALTAADPDVIIAMPCGFDLPRTAGEMHWLTDAPWWPKLRAVERGEVYLVDGNQYLNRPGPRVVESLLLLAEILHPDLFSPEHQGDGWTRWPSP